MSASSQMSLAIEDPSLDKLQDIKLYARSGTKPFEVDVDMSLLQRRDKSLLQHSDILRVQIVLPMIIINLLSRQAKEHVLKYRHITPEEKDLKLLDFVESTPLAKPPLLTRVSIPFRTLSSRNAYLLVIIRFSKALEDSIAAWGYRLLAAIVG
ncbi:hypothetical protein Bbelb_391100 [Branchiostoma belcheri]|nr:hypothetical protein Bbelb_441510 [Branchiostoma belcheri]KAI8483228.1 hypothetical protein Bbelb_391100 [Branchiostoma belcheri]